MLFHSAQFECFARWTGTWLALDLRQFALRPSRYMLRVRLLFCGGFSVNSLLSVPFMRPLLLIMMLGWWRR
jgi:hypothetical protein